jgi:hypothetical protein
VSASGPGWLDRHDHRERYGLGRLQIIDDLDQTRSSANERATMKTAKILKTARGASPSHCSLRYVELEELIGEFGRRTRLGKLAAALRTRLEEEDWDGSELASARAEYEQRLHDPDSGFMAGLRRSTRAGVPRRRAETSRS